MTYAEFIEDFNTKFYAATTVESLGWEEDEICHFLNSAQIQIINTFVGQRRFKEISNITRFDESLISGSVDTTTDVRQFLTGPPDMLHFITATLTFTKVDVPREVAMEEVPADDIYKFIKSTENKTLFARPKIAVLGEDGVGELVYVVDSYTTAVTKIGVQYVKTPTEFDSGTPAVTDLNEALHDDIVNTAVQIAVKSMIGTQQSSQ